MPHFSAQEWFQTHCQCRKCIPGQKEHTHTQWNMVTHGLASPEPSLNIFKAMWDGRIDRLRENRTRKQTSKDKLWMSFNKPGELVSKATYRSYKKVSIREFRLCWRIKVVILIFALMLFRVVKTQFLSYTAYFCAYLKSRYRFFLISLQNIKKWGGRGSIFLHNTVDAWGCFLQKFTSCIFVFLAQVWVRFKFKPNISSKMQSSDVIN